MATESAVAAADIVGTLALASFIFQRRRQGVQGRLQGSQAVRSLEDHTRQQHQRLAARSARNTRSRWIPADRQPAAVRSGSGQLDAIDQVPRVLSGGRVGLTLLTAPSTEPMSVDEAKVHLRESGTSQDSLIQSLIIAARELRRAIHAPRVRQADLATLDRRIPVRTA
jgi:hypothetical protein